MKFNKVLLAGVLASVLSFGLATNAYAIGSGSCTLKTDKSSYEYGEMITFSWTTANANYAVFQTDNSGKDSLDMPGDKLETAGTIKVPADVTGNPVVVLEVFDAQGIGNACSVTFKVTESDGADESDDLAEPRITFWSNTIKENGSILEYHLAWEVKNAQRCVLDDGSYEYNVGVRGAKEVAPTKKTTYTLWCANDSGDGKDGPSDSEKIRLNPVDGEGEQVVKNSNDDRDKQIAQLQALLEQLIKQLIALLAAQR